MTNHTTSQRRCGATIIEFVVACSLLGVLILFVVPLAIRIGQVQRTMRHDRIAMDEVSNQLDRLTRLPVDTIQQEIKSLTLSRFAEDGLPDACLTGALDKSEEGHRMVLEIVWTGSAGHETSLSMATWIFPPTTERTKEGRSE